MLLDVYKRQVLLGKAFLVAPSGEETELKLGEEWAFQASPEEIDVTLTLLADQNLYEEMCIRDRQ